MSLDLGGPALEIAIALAFVFFLLSLIASELTELVANFFKLRAETLREGLEGMLGDEAVAEEVLKHPLVRSDLRKESKHTPSYIAPRDFAAAFQDLISAPPAATENPRPTIRVRDADGETHDAQVTGKLAAQLSTLSGSATAIPAAPALEKWFDESMDRVSGWYKRKSKWITLGIGVFLVVVLNVSALRIADHLAAEPTVRAAVVAKAEAAAADGADEGEEGLTRAGRDVEKAVDDLGDLNLPVFWAAPNVPDWTYTDVGLTAVGWLITIFAISLGAPFWFDALGRLSNLRMAGKKPAGAASK